MMRASIKRNSTRRAAAQVLAAVLGQVVAKPLMAQTASYVSLARAYLAAPVVAAVTVREQAKPPKLLRDPAAARLVITADTQRVFKAPQPLSARFSYLWSGAADAAGKLPAFRKQSLVVFLQSFSPPPGDRASAAIVLRAAADQQLPATPDVLSLLQLIGQQAASASLSALSLTGTVSASTTPTDAPFARFTQLLLPTRAGTLLALTVRTRADGTADLVQGDTDVLGSGTPIARDTLLWFHLACQMPATLPADTTGDAYGTDPAERATIAADYQTARTLLGACA